MQDEKYCSEQRETLRMTLFFQFVLAELIFERLSYFAASNSKLLIVAVNAVLHTQNEKSSTIIAEYYYFP